MICHYCVVDFPHPPTEDCKTDINEGGIPEAITDAVASVLGRPPKDENDMTDPESAGRKRAAALIPKESMGICEWSMMKEAGGGVFPIKGCFNNKATDRHHGPDKNTLHNERHTNLHAICSFCHNRWHADNDASYVGERPRDNTPWLPIAEYKPHDPEGALMSRKEALVEELKRSDK